MNEDSRSGDQGERPLTNDELLGWIEFGCWTMLALTPVLYYVNGPAVSPDQLVMRSALVITAAIGALALRLRRWRMNRAPAS